MYKADTIVARATAPGRAAVAIVRLSGSDAFAIADRILRLNRTSPPRPWQLHRAMALDADTAEPIDDVLAVRMPGPRTYTGEDVAEIQCHGSPLVVERVISSALRSGARLAERGEFTRRAVLNGRMDLVQAEAVADLIDARVAGGALSAWRQLQGALSSRLVGLREAVLSELAVAEAHVDFSDDDLPDESTSGRLRRLEEIERELARLLGGFAAARRWREGHRVVFAGRPNVGKSSLLNAILGANRMIVSAEPGTTRDSVEEAVDLGGVAFVLTDTAGVRETPSVAEAEAVERARDRADEADIVAVVLDATVPLSEEDVRLLRGCAHKLRIVILNKTDLPAEIASEEVAAHVGESAPIVALSAKTGAGCDRLADTLVSLARGNGDSGAGEPTISRVRHRTAIAEARRGLQAAIDLVRDGGASELAAIELRSALHELASLTDPVDNEDVLDRIFRDFCIGK